MDDLGQIWSRSKAFRIVLVIVAIYALLRLAVHFVYLTVAFPDDLRVYLEAAENLLLRHALYPTGALSRADSYQYAPSFALAFTLFQGWPHGLVAVIHSLLHIGAYSLLYVEWNRLFRRLGLDRANGMMAWLLPVWLVFGEFWGDLGFLNVYIFMALLATLLIDAILDEHLGWSLVWVSVILQIKPMWAFAILVPVLLGRYRFFFKLLALTLVAYAAIVGVTTLAMGPAYGWQQHLDYARHLAGMQGGNFAWRTPAQGFLGNNHSITQSIIYLMGVTLAAFRLATLVKLLILMPLVIVCVRHLVRPVGRAGREVPHLGLELAFALYLGVFIWLDVVWEITASIAVFTYLLATLDQHQRWAKSLVWVLFIPYALRDFTDLASFLILGDKALLPGGLYFVLDPTSYVPLVMIVILAFYGLLVWRLGTGRPAQRAATSLFVL